MLSVNASILRSRSRGEAANRYPVDAVAAGDEGQEPIGEEKVLERDQPFRQGMPSRGTAVKRSRCSSRCSLRVEELGAIDLL